MNEWEQREEESIPLTPKDIGEICDSFFECCCTTSCSNGIKDCCFLCGRRDNCDGLCDTVSEYYE